MTLKYTTDKINTDSVHSFLWLKNENRKFKLANKTPVGTNCDGRQCVICESSGDRTQKPKAAELVPKVQVVMPLMPVR